MTVDQLNTIANRWFDAFNEHDLEALLSLYDDHARHYSPKLKLRRPETNGWVTGKASLRSWWQDAFERLPHLHYHVLRLTPCDDRVFMEYIRKVPGEDDMLVGELLEIKNGLIIQSMVFHT